MEPSGETARHSGALTLAPDEDLVHTRQRLVIDLDARTVAAGPWSAELAPDDPPDAVLIRYLAGVYEMRGLAEGTAVPFRSLDVTVLAEALALSPAEIEGRLAQLMHPDDGRVERCRSALARRLVVPAAGIALALTAAGALLLLPPEERTSPGPGATQATEPAPPGADVPVIGEAVTIER